MSDKLNIVKIFKTGETFIYIITGIMLFISALFVVYEEVISFLAYPDAEDHLIWLVQIIDKALLLLMIIEILHTISVSIENHKLCSEPFLVVGLIAAIRRILVISVETAYVDGKFDHHMIEISILGGLILIFVASIIMLRKTSERSTQTK